MTKTWTDARGSSVRSTSDDKSPLVDRPHTCTPATVGHESRVNPGVAAMARATRDMAAVDDLTELVGASRGGREDGPFFEVEGRVRRPGAHPQNAQGRRGATAGGEAGHRPASAVPRAGRVCSSTISTSERSPRCPARSPRRRRAPTDAAGTRTGSGRGRRRSAAESSGRGAGGVGRGGRRRYRQDGPDRRRSGRVAGPVGPHPGGRGRAGFGGGRGSRAAARPQRRQPTRPGARSRHHRGDQIRAHPQAAEHGQVLWGSLWVSACSTSATCGCSSGTRTSSGCPTWACG